MNIQEIKQRTKSIKNTLQITKAMELIASIKMRKAIEVAQASREYSDRARELLSRLAAEGKSYKHPLLANPDSNKSLLIITSSDKGLCGSHNTEIFRASYKAIEEKRRDNREVNLIVIGNKARNHFRRIKELKITADFETFGDSIEYLEASPIAQLIIEEFSKGEYSEVDITFRQFESMIRQNAQVVKILPLLAIGRDDPAGRLPEEVSAYGGSASGGRSQKSLPTADQPKAEEVSARYEFEPEPEKVLDSILPQLVKIMVYQTLLENNASEHAARMVAMKNASDAAGEIIQDLEFTYNRLRQEKITSEISEIASGAEALS